MAVRTSTTSSASGISVQLVLVVESPEGVRDGVDKGAQVVLEGFGKYCPSIRHNVAPIIFQRACHFRDGNVGP